MSENTGENRVLFYRYGNICEEDVKECFRRAGVAVAEEDTQVSRKETTYAETVETVSALLREEAYLFVFSINFFPAVSDVCRVFRVPYVCWTVDCPVMELFSPALKNDCNRLFFFDRAQHAFFAPGASGAMAAHLPLATNPARWDDVIRSAGKEEAGFYASDVSFVGSLYGEKNRYRRIKESLGPYTEGYFDAVAEAASRVYGANLAEPHLQAEMIEEMSRYLPEMQASYCRDDARAKRFYAAHMVLDWESTQRERERLLEAAAERFSLRLYTHSDASCVPHADVRPGVKTLTQMPLVFHHSKINLNITMRAIETGIPLRVYDVCGAGGFLLTNYQEELAEQFVIGEEIEVFFSEEEMLDKISYYLTHEEERREIARRGYERICASHTYEHRIREMLHRMTEMS